MKKNINKIQNQVARYLDECYKEKKIKMADRSLVTFLNEKQKTFDVGFMNEKKNILDMSNRVFFNNKTEEDFDKNIKRQILSAIDVLLR